MDNKSYSDPDMGSMAGYDPNLGMGKSGYEKATAAHAAALVSHLKSVGMTPQSPGAKQVVDGIHKAAVAGMFGSPQNSGSTPQSSRGTSSGFMVG